MQANGFYGSRGVSGLIPKAYSMLEKDFYEQTCKKGSDLRSSLTYTNGEEDVRVATKQRCGIRLYEYQRHGWTFHAKGLWCYNQDEALPYMTLIGSSNFGYRSKHRDLEAQLFLTTLDPALRAKLKEETDLLFLHGRRVRHAHFLERSRSGGPMSLFAAQLVRSWL
jgi:CDP-diacylglycerol--glycerol-3-phosphate 3-phosphatidyltransferase